MLGLYLIQEFLKFNPVKPLNAIHNTFLLIFMDSKRIEIPVKTGLYCVFFLYVVVCVCVCVCVTCFFHGFWYSLLFICDLTGV